MKFAEIIQKNNQLAGQMTGQPYPVVVLSNIILNQFKPIIEFNLRSEGINANCTNGDYDNILQDSKRFHESQVVFIFWELANMVDGFQYKANLLTADETEQYIARFKSEIDFTFAQLAKTPLVILNKFSTLAFNQHLLKKNNFDTICDILNEYVAKNTPANVVIIDTDKVAARVSTGKSYDFRNYYSSKSLYSLDFMREYVSYVSPVIKSVNGKSKKALILDCDNTLWNGIIGEDGMEGILLSAKNAKGVVYEEVQYIAKELASKGILIGLNSKNNAADVEEVLNSHPDMKLTQDEIIIKKVNWDDKAGNLQQIAKELNIGIDSLVFMDDSDFEINLVNDFVPQVKTIQVPKERYMYPEEVRKQLGLFYVKNETREDAERARMYKQEFVRETSKSAFQDMEEYLRSLDLAITIHVNNKTLVPRTAQLTQKTNQFNLTTKRYTEADITNFIDDQKHLVFAFDVKDKFGEFGTTGVAIAELGNEVAVIDSLLMSCRVLGRNIEVRFIDEILKTLATKGIKSVKSAYTKTLKNDQVKELYDTIGFGLISGDETSKNYQLDLADYNYHELPYIKVEYSA